MWLCQVRQVPGLISQAQNQGRHRRFLKGKTTTVVAISLAWRSCIRHALFWEDPSNTSVWPVLPLVTALTEPLLRKKKLRYTLDLRQAPRQKQHTTALQVFDFLGFRKSAGMVAKEKLSQLDVTYCLTFILSESFNNSRNSLKQRPEVQPFRDHPFKTSTNFHKFLTPTPPTVGSFHHQNR